MFWPAVSGSPLRAHALPERRTRRSASRSPCWCAARTPTPSRRRWRSSPPATRPEAYVGRADFAGQFGASLVDLAAVEEFAKRHDLAVVQADAARRTVVLSGTVARFNAPSGSTSTGSSSTAAPTAAAPARSQCPASSTASSKPCSVSTTGPRSARISARASPSAAFRRASRRPRSRRSTTSRPAPARTSASP